ncbi:hypothetical protein NM208_g6035 [Fusarium decemcellulare]|uniref:Uncharacterized protein n=1 Tax=Fusarium decemcellulare TaxID=57161 RepID=A0ACC1SEN2_9HYPO|nr:hypothetical protein NM208_g6035 [Fusarium decemcellulare]
MSLNPFQRLPSELMVNIAKACQLPERKNFSLTNSTIHRLILPCLFKTIRIPCPLEKDSGLDGFIEKYKHLVLHVHLHVSLRGNIDYDAFENGFDNPFFPLDPKSLTSTWGATPAIAKIVRNIVMGQTIPRCAHLSIQFDPDDFNNEHGLWESVFHGMFGGLYPFTSPEDWSTVSMREAHLIWRQHLSEVWRDIAANSSIRRLDISNLLPKRSLFWQTSGWAAFLAGLDELNIEIFGGKRKGIDSFPEIHAGGHTVQVGEHTANTQQGFCDFVLHLPNDMILHAANLRRLGITGHRDGVVGVLHPDKLIPLPLPLDDDVLPLLEYLQLDKIFVESTLLDFLEVRGSGLRELHLHNCTRDSATRHSAGEPTWAYIWRYVRMSCTGLTKVSYTQDVNPPLTIKDCEGGELSIPEDAPKEDTDEICRVRKRLQKDKNLILWRYSEVDRKTGFVFERWGDVLRNFEDGEDNLQWQALKAAIQERQASR